MADVTRSFSWKTILTDDGSQVQVGDYLLLYFDLTKYVSFTGNPVLAKITAIEQDIFYSEAESKLITGKRYTTTLNDEDLPTVQGGVPLPLFSYCDLENAVAAECREPHVVEFDKIACQEDGSTVVARTTMLVCGVILKKEVFECGPYDAYDGDFNPDAEVPLP